LGDESRTALEQTELAFDPKLGILLLAFGRVK
jgi:hypothetical protein